MVRNKTPRFVNDSKNYLKAITANSTTDIFTAPTGGVKISGLLFATDNSATATAKLEIEDVDNSASITLGILQVTSGAGTIGGNPTINGLNATDLPGLPDDAHGNPFIEVEEGFKFKVTPASLTITASKTLHVTVLANTLEADS